jgi:excisionase family DNA binding protein
MNHEKTDKLTYTCPEAAMAAGISIPMVRKLIRTRKLTAIRIGRCVRIPASSLQQLLQRGTQ